MGQKLSSAKRLMPLYKEMVNQVIFESRPKANQKSGSKGARGMKDAIGVKRLETIAEYRQRE